MKRWITLATMLLGSASFGLVFYHSESPRVMPTLHQPRALPAVTAGVEREQTQVIDLAPMRITATAAPTSSGES